MHSHPPGTPGLHVPQAMAEQLAQQERALAVFRGNVATFTGHLFAAGLIMEGAKTAESLPEIMEDADRVRHVLEAAIQAAMFQNQGLNIFFSQGPDDETPAPNEASEIVTP